MTLVETSSIVCFLSFYKFNLLLQEENRKYFFVSLLSNLEKMCNRFNTSAKDCKHYVMGCGGGTVLASVWIFLQVYTIRLSSGKIDLYGNSVVHTKWVKGFRKSLDIINQRRKIERWLNENTGSIIFSNKAAKISQVLIFEFPSKIILALSYKYILIFFFEIFTNEFWSNG